MVQDAPHRESTPRTKGVCIVAARGAATTWAEVLPTTVGWRLLRQSDAAVDLSVRTTGAVPSASMTGSGSPLMPGWLC